MISARSLRSGEGAGSVRVWVSVVWVASAVTFGVGETVQLTAKPRVEVLCGQNVTMTCKVNIMDLGGIKLFKWIADNKTCEFGKDYADNKVVCESEERRLSLTILNVMPGDQGDYLCKLHSKTGAKSTKTALTIPSCFDRPEFLVDAKQARCCFTGVYPHGFIHWFQRDVNLTDSAVRQPDVVDQEGRYGVCSTLPAQRRNPRLPLTCALWSPAKNYYLFRSADVQPPTDSSETGGTVSLRANLTVVLIMVALAMKGSSQRLMMQ